MIDQARRYQLVYQDIGKYVKDKQHALDFEFWRARIRHNCALHVLFKSSKDLKSTIIHMILGEIGTVWENDLLTYVLSPRGIELAKKASAAGIISVKEVGPVALYADCSGVFGVSDELRAAREAEQATWRAAKEYREQSAIAKLPAQDRKSASKSKTTQEQPTPAVKPRKKPAAKTGDAASQNI
jgi:hypothetical protein